MKHLKTVGRYKIESILGEGAMGIVYKAHDPIIKRTVAIKVIKVDDSVSDAEKKEFYDRFYREAQISGTLNHPNIVGIYDIGEEQGMPYIAMEFVEGRTLSTIIAENSKLDVETAVKIVSQVSSALDYAHKKEIVHRDIKPGNIMIGEDSRCKIMDFGIARLQNSSLTQTGAFLGTPSYCSPEQITEGKIDHRSDIFSLGTVTFEMVTGTLPFRGKTLSSILYKIAHEPPEKITNAEQYGIDTPSWQKLFTRIFSKTPDDRFQSSKEFAAEFARAVTLTSSQKSRIRKLLVDNAVDTETAIDKQLFRSEYEIERAHHLSHEKKSSKAKWIVFAVFMIIITGGMVGAYIFTNGKILSAINEPIKKIFTKSVNKNIVIQSNAENAEIYFDGILQGHTSSLLKISGQEGDEKKLTIKKDSYYDSSLKLTLHSEMKTEYMVELTSKTVAMDIMTEPAQVSFKVDNGEILQTPKTINIDSTKDHVFHFFADGFEDKSVTLKKGDILEKITMKPEAKPGWVQMDSEFPVDVEMKIDGQWKSMGTKDPNEKFKLEAGFYAIRLNSSKYFFSKYISKFNVVANTTNYIHLPAKGKIQSIWSNLWAYIEIDGRRIEEQAPTRKIIELVVGSHTIKLYNPDENKELTFEVNINSTTPLNILKRF